MVFLFQTPATASLQLVASMSKQLDIKRKRMQTYYNDSPRNLNFKNKSMELSIIIDHFLAVSPHKDSYIGLINDDHELLHFYWIANNKWLVDHPVEVNMLHQQCYATTEECLVFIKKISQEYNPRNFKGFVNVPIKHFTLEEMLEFKKEDELLLKGQDPF